MVLGICSNILEEMKNFQLDRFRFVVTGFISERAEQGLSFKSYAVTDNTVDDHFTDEFTLFPALWHSDYARRSLSGRWPFGLCRPRGKYIPWKMFEILSE